MATKLKDAEKALQAMKALINSGAMSPRTKEHLKAVIESLERDIENVKKPK
jgi:hypothetical protein